MGAVVPVPFPSYRGPTYLYGAHVTVEMRCKTLQSTIGTIIFNVLDPLYDLLKSLSVEVQVEGRSVYCASLWYTVLFG